MAISGVDPEVTLEFFYCMLFVTRTDSFWRITTKKSLLKTKLEDFSNSGTQQSLVTPGYTVDSKITMSFFFKTLPTVLDASNKGVRSGRFTLSIGVGTVTI